MQKITFKNSNGQSITLKDTFPCLLQELSGIGAPTVTALTRRGFQQDGVSHFGNLLNPRIISFRAVISALCKAELIALREELIQVFNPSLGSGELSYENGEARYTINGYIYDGPKEIPQVGVKGTNMQIFNIDFLCPRPAWELKKDPVEMIGFTGGVQFADEETQVSNPFIMQDAPGDGLILGTQGDVRTIEYDGNLEAPLIITFEGPAVLPKIINTQTGEFIEVAVELLDDEKLVIDTQPDAIDVYKIDSDENRTSAFGYINPLSTYFLLHLGSNKLEFYVSSGQPVVVLKYNEQYVGV